MKEHRDLIPVRGLPVAGGFATYTANSANGEQQLSCQLSAMAADSRIT
jgi:hypothetical protein